MRAVLFDLDGTLTDPAEGIVGGYIHALKGLGVEPPPAETLTWVIGPSLRATLPKFLGPDHDVETAVALYREYYGPRGLYEASVYDGIREAVTAIRGMADRVYVCTAKPTVYARRVVTHFGLDPLFEGVYGAELDGRFDDKGELIAHMVATLGLDPPQTVMVGDRRSDGTAAARNGARAIAVTWGYGTADEWADPSFDAVCAHPSELPGAVAKVLGSA